MKDTTKVHLFGAFAPRAAKKSEVGRHIRRAQMISDTPHSCGEGPGFEGSTTPCEACKLESQWHELESISNTW